nr:DsrE family protein [Microbacterium immunditiarum]
MAEARVRVVVQGAAVTGLARGAGLDDEVLTALERRIEVVGCSNSMKRHDVRSDQLADGVGVVPSAIVHLAERQWAGAAYVRI